MSVATRRRGRTVLREVALDLNDLGRSVAEARAAGVPWKWLEDMAGYSRQHLAETAAAAEKIVTLQIRQGQGRRPDLNLVRRLLEGE